MRKILLLSLTLIFLLGLTAIALAGGYNPYDDQLNQKYIVKPHGDGTGAFYNNSTNFCKTCHAVHLAGLVTPSGDYEAGYALGNAWRLLRATSAEDSCNYCHEGAGAHTNKIQYNRTLGVDVWGEHTIGATSIPDSNLINGAVSPMATSGTFYGGVGLSCNMCHSVHGAQTITGDADWNTKILRRDPYGNAGSADNGIRDIPGPSGGTPYATTPINSENVQSGFCGDCHTLNVNWTDETDPNDPRLNVHTHPLNTDGEMIVNGQPITVSGGNASDCTSCHPEASDPSGDPQFPHQSQGHKLLRSFYSPPNGYPLGAGEDVNNPQRQLPSLDFICRLCHGPYVGVTF